MSWGSYSPLIKVLKEHKLLGISYIAWTYKLDLVFTANNLTWVLAEGRPVYLADAILTNQCEEAL